MSARMTASLILICAFAAAGAREETASLHVVSGVEADGGATAQWLTMLRKRLTPEEYVPFETSIEPLDDAERAWETLIRSHAPAWEGRRDGLAAPFPGVEPPESVSIVMGNRGGNDAFTHDPVTIGFDLSALQSVYGDASLPVNADRIDRLFDHEYTHLLQKAWMVDHPYAAGSSQRAALLDIWLEGLGNYRSLSTRWRAREGTPSEDAGAALDRLTPRFVARLAALACASEADAAPLLANLSRGPFLEKWGALTAALWLEAETSRDPAALRAFVLAGPDGVWSLADRHLPGTLRAVLSEARAAAAACRETR